jgi:hypothetical protein
VVGPTARSAQRTAAKYFIEKTNSPFRQSLGRLDDHLDSAIGIESIPAVSPARSRPLAPVAGRAGLEHEKLNGGRGAQVETLRRRC